MSTSHSQKASVHLACLSALVGNIVSRVERLQYQYDAKIEGPSGDLQLWFGDRIIRFRGGADGERLEIETTAWLDPFAGDMNEINIDYIAKHGRYVISDISTDLGYRDIVGHVLLELEPRLGSSGQLTGVTLRFETAMLHVRVEFDELLVSWGANIPSPGSED